MTEAEPLTTGWEPDVAVDDTVLRQFVHAYADRVVATATVAGGDVHPHRPGGRRGRPVGVLLRQRRRAAAAARARHGRRPRRRGRRVRRPALGAAERLADPRLPGTRPHPRRTSAADAAHAGRSGAGASRPPDDPRGHGRRGRWPTSPARSSPAIRCRPGSTRSRSIPICSARTVDLLVGYVDGEPVACGGAAVAPGLARDRLDRHASRAPRKGLRRGADLGGGDHTTRSAGRPARLRRRPAGLRAPRLRAVAALHDVDEGVARMTTVDSVSQPSRLAEPGEGISEEELRLAGRNHSMPLEALHYDVTPAGMHYLLTHYDIPAIVPESHTVIVRRAGRAPDDAEPRRPEGTPAPHPPRHPRMRRQRPRAARTASGEPAVAVRGGGHRRVDRARRSRRYCGKPASDRMRATSSSPAPTTAWRRASNRTTSAGCRWQRRCATTSCWRTR